MSFPIRHHPNVLLQSRTVIVGGSSGIGGAVASAVLASGGAVFISSFNADKILLKIAELQAIYPTSLIGGAAADLSDENNLEQHVTNILESAVKDLGGPVDHFVYTAGDAYEGKTLAQLDPKTYFKAWNVRYLAPLVFAKIITCNAGKYVKVDAASSITLTSGGLAHRPIAGVSTFVGWAGAIEASARGLALELAPMRVNVVAPGAIYTEMLATLSTEMIAKFGRSTLVNRIGAVGEAAEAYLYCMRSAFVTGEVIKIDGGATLV